MHRRGQKITPLIGSQVVSVHLYGSFGSIVNYILSRYENIVCIFNIRLTYIYETLSVIYAVTAYS